MLKLNPSSTTPAGVVVSSECKALSMGTVPIPPQTQLSSPFDQSRFHQIAQEPLVVAHKSCIPLQQMYSFLSEDECRLFIEMFQNWPLSTRLFPIDLFVVDILDQLGQLKGHNQPCFSNMILQLENYVIPIFFFSYLHFLGKNLALNNQAVRLANDQKFFVLPNKMSEYIKTAIQIFTIALVNARSAIKIMTGKKTVAFMRQKKKNQSLTNGIQNIDSLIKKFNLLEKFYQQNNPDQLLTQHSLALITEAQVMDENLEGHFCKMMAYIKYIDQFIKLGSSPKSIGQMLEQAHNTFPSLLQQFSSYESRPKELECFFECYFDEYNKCLSDRTDSMRAEYLSRSATSIVCKTSPEHFAKVRATQKAALTQEEFCARFFLEYVNTTLYSHLLDNVANVVNNVLAFELKGVRVYWQICARRLSMNLKSLRWTIDASPSSRIERFIAEEIALIFTKSSTYLTEHHAQFSTLLTSLNNCIKDNSASEIYKNRLSDSQPFIGGLSFIEIELCDLCKRVVECVCTEHQASPSEELRKQLSLYLIQCAEPLLRLIMICKDYNLILTNSIDKPRSDLLLLSPTLLDGLSLMTSTQDTLVETKVTTEKTDGIARRKLKKQHQPQKSSTPDPAVVNESRRRCCIEWILKQCRCTSNGFPIDVCLD